MSEYNNSIAIQANESSFDRLNGRYTVAQAAEWYFEYAHWGLVPMRKGAKVPDAQADYLPENYWRNRGIFLDGQTWPAEYGAIGLPLYNNDIDTDHRGLFAFVIHDMARLRAWLEDDEKEEFEHDYDLGKMIKDNATVRITTGDPNKITVLYRATTYHTEELGLDESVQYRDNDGRLLFEFLYVDPSGRTPIVLLPPSIDPDTGMQRRWAGSCGDFPRFMSAELRGVTELWRFALGENEYRKQLAEGTLPEGWDEDSLMESRKLRKAKESKPLPLREHLKGNYRAWNRLSVFDPPEDADLTEKPEPVNPVRITQFKRLLEGIPVRLQGFPLELEEQRLITLWCTILGMEGYWIWRDWMARNGVTDRKTLHAELCKVQIEDTAEMGPREMNQWITDKMRDGTPPSNGTVVPFPTAFAGNAADKVSDSPQERPQASVSTPTVALYTEESLERLKEALWRLRADKSNADLVFRALKSLGGAGWPLWVEWCICVLTVNPEDTKALWNDPAVPAEHYEVLLRKVGIDGWANPGGDHKGEDSKEIRESQASEIGWLELTRKQFEPIAWVVDEILPPGVSLLIGRPKMGKSWFLLKLMLLSCAGRNVFGKRTHGGEALYLALEDTEQRLQARTRQLMKTHILTDQAIQGLTMMTVAPRMDQGLGKVLCDHLAAHPDCTLVGIDVLAMIRPPRQSNQQLYDWDYQVGKHIKEIAKRYPRVAFILVHHANKGTDGDGLNAVSGTNGLAAGCDNVYTLINGDRGPELQIHARDVEDSRSIDLIKGEDGTWTLESRESARDKTRSDTRKKILETLTDLKEPAAPKDLAQLTKIKVETIQAQLRRMLKQGEVIRTGYGSYTLPGAWAIDQAADQITRNIHGGRDLGK